MSDKASLARETAYVTELPGFTRTEPQYFKDPMIDRLLEVVLMMGGELWAVRDRMMVMERLMAAHGRVTPDMIETYAPDPAFKEQSERERWNFVRRVFAGLYGQPMPEDNKNHFEWVTRKPDQSKADKSAA
ncbi:MAG: hypothetical protein SFV21_18145 [Rhodospirillaceae bacterium]|nr:hypothetical protein [Rhodospirillaceae bacterium]